MIPGSAIPWSNVYLILGAVISSGKLSLVVEYEEGTVDTDTMNKIKDKTMELFFLNEKRK